MLSITSTLHYREEENELYENNFPHTKKNELANCFYHVSKEELKVAVYVE